MGLWAASAYALLPVMTSPGESPLQLTFVFLATVVFSDAFSGLFHWATDNYGNGDTPVFGEVIAAFQGHHVNPWTITHRSFFNNGISYLHGAAARKSSTGLTTVPLYGPPSELGPLHRQRLVADCWRVPQVLLMLAAAGAHFWACHSCPRPRRSARCTARRSNSAQDRPHGHSSPGRGVRVLRKRSVAGVLGDVPQRPGAEPRVPQAEPHGAPPGLGRRAAAGRPRHWAQEPRAAPRVALRGPLLHPHGLVQRRARRLKGPRRAQAQRARSGRVQSQSSWRKLIQQQQQRGAPLSHVGANLIFLKLSRCGDAWRRWCSGPMARSPTAGRTTRPSKT